MPPTTRESAENAEYAENAENAEYAENAECAENAENAECAEYSPGERMAAEGVPRPRSEGS